jgi:hypothetical protein
VALSSATTGEDLLALMVANVHALLDQSAALLGAAGAPSPAAVLVTLASLLAVNSVFYIFLLHVLYAALLRPMGLAAGREPAFARRLTGAE